MASTPEAVTPLNATGPARVSRRVPALGECLLASAVAAAILAARAPVLLYPAELNADESQMLAQAMRYTRDFMPWRGVDGTSGGPLNSWYLLLPHLLGMRIYYPAAHLLAALSWSASALSCWLAARLAFGARGAMAGLAMLVAWIACEQGIDYLQYSSEVVSVLLLSLALVGAVSGGAGRYASALLLGMVPWAKIQAAPIAVVIGVWMVARILLRPDQPSEASNQGRIRTAAMVVGFSLLPSVLLVAFVARAGALEEMWRSYFVGNLYYAGPFRTSHVVAELADRKWEWKTIPWSCVLLALWAAGLAARRERTWRVDALGFAALAWLTFFASWYVAARPVRLFGHYQFLLLPGLVLLTAAAVKALQEGPSVCEFASRFCWVPVGLYLLMNLGPAMGSLRHMLREQNPTESAAKFVLAQIGQVAPGSRGILVWGWFPSLYVESGVPPPTRHVISHFLNGGNPSREFLRSTYMADLLAERPQVFVDAHMTFLDSKFPRDPIRKFPALDEYVRAHFAWVCSLDTTLGPVDIYRRKGPG
jgi:hypothetical protein